MASSNSEIASRFAFEKFPQAAEANVFVDRSVLEVFANEIACVTKTISPLEANAALEIRVEGGNANAKRIQAWPMKTIW